MIEKMTSVLQLLQNTVVAVHIRASATAIRLFLSFSTSHLALISHSVLLLLLMMYYLLHCRFGISCYC